MIRKSKTLIKKKVMNKIVLMIDMVLVIFHIYLPSNLFQDAKRNLGWNASTNIKLIHKLTFLLTSNPLYILMLKLLKSMIVLIQDIFNV